VGFALSLVTQQFPGKPFALIGAQVALAVFFFFISRAHTVQLLSHRQLAQSMVRTYFPDMLKTIDVPFVFLK
jgi:hypothetical protein